MIPLLPLSTWVPILDGDDDARALFDRHYSRYHYADGRKPKLFCGPGFKLVLSTPCRRALFVWRKFISADGQQGVNCAIFRNEGGGAFLRPDTGGGPDRRPALAGRTALHLCRSAQGQEPKPRLLLYRRRLAALWCYQGAKAADLRAGGGMSVLSPVRRPLMRYHGGKSKDAPWIIGHFPPHRTYVEPFGGGASVLLRKARSHQDVYNDLDGEVVNVFRVVREAPAELLRGIELTPFSREEFDLSFTSSDDPVEQARRTILRSFAGFGSNVFKLTRDGRRERTGFRADSNKSGTTPAGDWRNYPEHLVRVIDRMRGVVIENRPAIEVMRAHDRPGALHYVDPPYVLSTRGAGHDYRHEMSDDDHVELAAFLRGLQGYVVVSGYPSTLYDDLFSGWRCVHKAALADGARPRVECLWISPNVPRGSLFEHLPLGMAPVPETTGASP